jgi:NAD+ kinase
MKGKIPAFPQKEFRLVVTLGGDGTVLYTARQVFLNESMVFPINLGSVGFLAEISQSEWPLLLQKALNGHARISSRIVATVGVVRKKKLIASYYAVNEAVVNAAKKSHLIKFHVHLSDDSVGTYRADGIIVATPTGSTAYSVAAGGPVVQPEMEAFIINPVCPYVLSSRPIVIPSTEKITVRLDSEQRTALMLTIDGQEALDLKPEDEMVITRAPGSLCLVTSDKRSFYDVLSSKLNWLGG